MKKRITFIAINLFLAIMLKAQEPDTLWTKTIGGSEWEIAYSVQQTTDGGFIIVGLTNTYGAGGNDIYLVKTDSNGDTLWTRTYGTPEDQKAYSVKQTMDNGYIIAGRTFIPPDVWLIKTDVYGDTIWTVVEGGIDDDEVNDVVETDDGYFIAVGTTRSYGQGGADIYFVETTSDASTVWDDAFGGYANDFGQSVIDTDIGYVFAGCTSNFGAGSFDAWIVCIDWDDYDIIWQQTFGGEESDRAYSISETWDDGFICCGTSESFIPDINVGFLFRMNSDGDSIWSKGYELGEYTSFRSVKETPDGGFIAAGYSRPVNPGNADWYILRTDAVGNILWEKEFGGDQDDECFDVQLTSDGGYILTGMTRSKGAGNADIYLIKIGPDLVGVEDHLLTKDHLKIQIFPNPIDKITKVGFTLPKGSPVDLRIFDIHGKMFMNHSIDHLPKGIHEFTINSIDLPAGVYFCTIKTNNGIQTTKMIKL